MVEVPTAVPGWGFVPVQVVPVQSVWTATPLKFSGGLETDQDKVCRILCYGDSMTVGFCCGGSAFEPYARSMAHQLGLVGAACEITVCGLSGRRADEMVAMADGVIVDNLSYGWKGLERTLREDGPFDLVLIMAGTNDMGAASLPEPIVDSLRCLHAVCHAFGVPTVALAPPPAPGRGAAWEALRLPIVEALSRLPSEMPGVIACVDPGLSVPASWNLFWDPDGLHFSVLGSCALGKALADLASRHFFPQLFGHADDAQEHAAWNIGITDGDVNCPQWQKSSMDCVAMPVFAWVLVQV